MEVLQMVKSYLKKEHLNFTRASVTTEWQMVDDVPDCDHLANLLIRDFYDGLDLIIQSTQNYN